MERFPERPVSEQNEQLPVRNLLEKGTREETLRAIATLEGPEWKEEQDRRQQECEEKIESQNITDPKEIEALARNTWFGLMRWLDNVQDHSFISGDQYILYGNGGFNRWAIKKDGSVSFLERYAQAGHVERAQELGFPILKDSTK